MSHEVISVGYQTDSKQTVPMFYFPFLYTTALYFITNRRSIKIESI